MFNLESLKIFGVLIYIFIYLIFPFPAITQTTKIDLRRNIENALNSRNLNLLKNSFEDEDTAEITKNFSNIIKEFPDSKWKIKKLKSKHLNENIFKIKVVGKKIVDGEIYILESNFDYVFLMTGEKIKKGSIKNLFTIVRNDQRNIDISFKIPNKVLTGAQYDIDIILNKPLGDNIIAGGIQPHQLDSFLKQEITLEPLVSGGIFKITRAPSKAGIQIWSGVIAHPKGIITFTKSVDIVENI